MPFLLLLLLIGVPLIEIALFIQVGDAIGLWPTLGVVVLTAIVGSILLRAQGLGTFARARASMDRGELPIRELFDAFCIVIGGALLLTPGFFTDSVGFALLLPPIRAVLRGWAALVVARRANVRMHRTKPGADDDPGKPGGGPTAGRHRSGEGSSRPGPVIEGEFEEVDEDEVGPRRDSRWGRDDQ